MTKPTIHFRPPSIRAQCHFSVSTLLLTTLVVGLVLANVISRSSQKESASGVLAKQTTRGFPFTYATTDKYQHPEDAKGLRRPSGGSFNFAALTGNLLVIALPIYVFALRRKPRRLESRWTRLLLVVAPNRLEGKSGSILNEAGQVSLHRGKQLSKGEVSAIVSSMLGFILLGNALLHPGLSKIPWLICSLGCLGVAYLSNSGKSRLAVVVGVVGCIASGGLAVREHQTAAEQAMRADHYRKAGLVDHPHLAIGSAAPEIRAPDLSGAEMTLGQYRGKVVMLVYWASWCAPCMGAVPHDLELYHHYAGRPFVIVGVNGDSDLARALKAKKESGLAWRSFQSGPKSKIVDDYGVQGWPTVYLIDGEGNIRYKGPHSRSLDDRIRQLVSEADYCVLPSGWEQ